MLEIVRSLLTSLGLNLVGIPDLVVVVVVIIGTIIVLRVLHNLLDWLLSFGCMIIAVIVITALLIEVF